jgi:hypothetical protein
MASTTTWTRVTRRLGFDHNPLRRRSDLIEAWLVPAMIAVFLTVGPLLAAAVGLWVHADNVAAQRADRSWHRVSAVLLQPAPGPLMSDNGANSWLVWTPARWTAGGQQHVAKVPATSGTSAGAVVPVWLNSAGRVQPPPPTPAGARDRITTGVSFAIAALALLLTGVALVARRLLDRRRIADWEAAWLSVGPQWSRH